MSHQISPKLVSGSFYTAEIRFTIGLIQNLYLFKHIVPH